MESTSQQMGLLGGMHMDSQFSHVSPKDFFFKVLNGTALGIIIGLIPNAILATILQYFPGFTLGVSLVTVVKIFQLATPLIIGAIISYQFHLDSLRSMTVAGAAFVGSGVITQDSQTYFDKAGEAATLLIGNGQGNITNTMLTAALAVLMVKVIKKRFGSAELVLTPLVIGSLAGLVGLYTLPTVSSATLAIGTMINYFTTLQPYAMSMLIAVTFAILIISPVSTVSIGIAVGLFGLSAGASAMGVASTTLVLIVHSWKTNNSGVTLGIAMGSMKMMMPNLFKYPVILFPVVTTAIVSSLSVPIFNITGTPASAGFGLVGLVGPLAGLKAGNTLAVTVLAWLVIPAVAALASYFVFDKLTKLYQTNVVFKYQEAE